MPSKTKRGMLSDKEIASINTKYRTTLKRVEDAQENVLCHEEAYNIEKRWEPGTPEYVDGQKQVIVLRYQAALSDLEKLVVQRLLELSKLSVSGVGT
jgi:hypothetical protein